MLERRWILFFVALVVGAVLDLGSKHWAFETLSQGPYKLQGSSMPLSSFFAFTLATNKGAAFGMFWGRFEFFMAVTIVAMAGLPYFVHTAPRRAVALPVVLGLILSGVIGNFWDRIIHGHVRDFLDVHTPPSGALYDFFSRTVGSTVWPTFNVADIFITGGAILLVLVLGRDAPPKADPKAPAAPGAQGEVQPGVASPVAAPAAPAPESAPSA